MGLNRLGQASVITGSLAFETDATVGEVCAIPVDQFPFSCFTCLEEILDESEMRFSEDLGV